MTKTLTFTQANKKGATYLSTVNKTVDKTVII